MAGKVGSTDGAAIRAGAARMVQGAVGVAADAGTRNPTRRRRQAATKPMPARYAACNGGSNMNSIVYMVGAVVIVLAILGFLGLR